MYCSSLAWLSPLRHSHDPRHVNRQYPPRPSRPDSRLTTLATIYTRGRSNHASSRTTLPTTEAKAADRAACDLGHSYHLRLPAAAGSAGLGWHQVGPGCASRRHAGWTVSQLEQDRIDAIYKLVDAVNHISRGSVHSGPVGFELLSMAIEGASTPPGSNPLSDAIMSAGHEIASSIDNLADAIRGASIPPNAQDNRAEGSGSSTR